MRDPIEQRVEAISALAGLKSAIIAPLLSGRSFNVQLCMVDHESKNPFPLILPGEPIAVYLPVCNREIEMFIHRQEPELVIRQGIKKMANCILN
jgi:hypothetical protein